jgi:hypothetical protein
MGGGVGEQGSMSGGRDRLAQLSQLERDLRDKSLLLADLEVIIQDYCRERSRLVEEIMSLRETLWDLKAQVDAEDTCEEVTD